MDAYTGGNATYTDDALQAIHTSADFFTASNVGDRQDTRDVGLLITSGDPNPQWRRDTALDAARIAKDSGITLYTVGVGAGVSESFLRDVSSYPNTRDQTYFHAATYNVLSQLVGSLVNTLCAEPTTPRPPLPVATPASTTTRTEPGRSPSNAADNVSSSPVVTDRPTEERGEGRETENGSGKLAGLQLACIHTWIGGLLEW